MSLPKTLEIHINLEHPALRHREVLDASRVAHLLAVIAETIGTTMQDEGPVRGCVLDGEHTEPLAYWIPTYRDDDTTPEED